jgi:hypothetical protein
MDRITAITIGAILASIGFIMFAYAATSNSSLEERYGWNPIIQAYSSRYEQEKNTNNFMGLIGFVLMISGLVVATRLPWRFRKNKSIYCSKCGFENRYEANFCKDCGNKL